MADDRTQAVTALLGQAQEAHHAYETTELNGVFDQAWPHWYAGYAVDHGIGELVGHAIATDQLAQLLARANADFEQIEPTLDEPWVAYTARRIAAEL